MRKLLTTLLPTPKYLKQSNLDKKYPTTFLLLLTTTFVIRVFIYNVCANCYGYI